MALPNWMLLYLLYMLLFDSGTFPGDFDLSLSSVSEENGNPFLTLFETVGFMAPFYLKYSIFLYFAYRQSFLLRRNLDSTS